jgi:transcriptional regulator with XRE-family HTH domain
MYISQNIKLLRNKRNISQEEFAHIFGLKRSSIGSYEEGRAVPPLGLIIKIAEYFGVGLELLITEDISKFQQPPEEYETSNPEKEIAYSHAEIALLAIKNDFFTRALLHATFEAISSWAEFTNPEIKNTLLTELPKMLADKYKELILKDQKISEDLAERLIQEIKDSLSKY